MLHHRTRLLLFTLCLLIAFVSQAQDNPQAVAPWSGFGVEVSAMAGKVFKHEAKFDLPIPKVSTGLDMDFVLHSFGRKSWEQRRKYPTIGIGITYTNYGIDSVYGRCVGIYPNIELPLVRGNRLTWTLRIGDGVGYVTKHFSRTNPVDTLNVAIGSHVNDFANFSTDLRYHINHHWDFQLGAHFTHISDASYDKPNLGVNMYGAHLGLTYFPVTSTPTFIKKELPKLKNRWLAEVRLSMAYVSANVAGGPLYPVYIASGYVSRRWLSKNKMFVGYDYSYHNDIYAFLRDNEIDPGKERQNSYKTAVFFGNEFMMGRLGIVLQVGVYTHQAALRTDAYYEKIGGHYYLIQKEHGPVKEFFLSAFLKTHKTIAELGEFGVGFGF